MPFQVQHDNLADLVSRDRLRSLVPQAGLDFSSNDYLGLAQSPSLRTAVQRALDRGVPIGAGGSRLLRGNHPEHEALEDEAARFFGSETSLYFSSGFAANTALFSTMPQREDLVLYDELIHASAHDGMRLGRADCRAVRHNDIQAYADAVRDWSGKGQIWIAVESLYSMDGDRAPLNELVTLADQYDAVLLIDEAHATGVLGPGGCGLAAELEGRENVITLRTCGKALGCEGALVCGPRTVTDFLINRGRSFIFSTAPSPLMASAVRAALKILATEPERRAELAKLCEVAAHKLHNHGVVQSGSQIMPLIIGDDRQTMTAARRLQQVGFDVRGIRPPTVPIGTSRLRISLTLNIDDAALDALANALPAALA
jgi:8-amino-7-oxononanoate synthase